jgi:hypothetical protein
LREYCIAILHPTEQPKFEVRQTGKLNLTSYSGLALIGQC